MDPPQAREMCQVTVVGPTVFLAVAACDEAADLRIGAGESRLLALDPWQTGRDWLR